jgi:hypothetical protein
MREYVFVAVIATLCALALQWSATLGAAATPPAATQAMPAG